MTGRTVDWTEGREGLRERKKRQTRRLLSDTATEMFLARGFDAVRVAEIAAACGVSEKTVYNYFPTKESLVVDHPDAAIEALRPALADAAVSPVDAVLGILDRELRAVASWLAAQPDPAAAAERFRRFGALVEATPALRAYQRDMADRLVAVAAEALAARAGLSPDDPEPQIAATALVGLWRVQFAALSRCVGSEGLQDSVAAEVGRAARIVDRGLGSWGVPVH
ncbi:TetR/AcrR family transcriptional regulator [Kutzneria sp. CA-103260]|uniref:TetR/AcrR family transcriptional regulator n=1 Tax=Kutzneria sp. CA-103260 TaxID=2802641 RepID=UPI002013279F|nr:TetR family transcriptional regulator [Kutzneria sp. CA-103260]